MRKPISGYEGTWEDWQAIDRRLQREVRLNPTESEARRWKTSATASVPSENDSDYRYRRPPSDSRCSRQNYIQLETRTRDPRLSTIVALVGLGMRATVIVPELVTRPAARLDGR